MKVLLATVIFIGAASIVFTNGVVAMVSPRAFFRLPWWLSLKGTLRRSEYSTNEGDFRIRVLGAAMCAVIVWLTWHFFFVTR